MVHTLIKSIAALAVVFTFAGCAGGPSMPPIKTAEFVDIDRFMGDWYVIANIPTFIEKEAYNAIESYELNENRVVNTTFTFNKGGFDGERKTYNPTGFIYDDPSNAIWGMRFIWPIKADYRIVYIDEDYQNTIIGRNKRDYVWIMSRSAQIDDATYTKLIAMVREQGYDTSMIRRVPQQASNN